MTHECITERRVDETAHARQLIVRCRCHMDAWRVWRPGDPPIPCPETGVDVAAGPGVEAS